MTMPDPADFGDNRKDAVTVYNIVDEEAVILHRSIALTPMPLCVQEAPVPCSSATTVCRKRGCKVVEEGGCA